MEPSLPRLNKFLALQLGISRREADDLIVAGNVLLNGKQAELGVRVAPKDVVKVNGKEIKTDAEKVYLALHKPVGYVSSRRQQGDAPTIYSLLPEEYHSLKPVGRLDKDSSGLLLLTNDGDFAHAHTHPSFYKTKEYEVVLDKPLEPLHQQMISDHGVALEDGGSKFLVSRQDDHYHVTMSEGRNRQIRRTFDALGYTVTGLHRTRFGSYELGSLEPGAYEPIKQR